MLGSEELEQILHVVLADHRELLGKLVESERRQQELREALTYARREIASKRL